MMDNTTKTVQTMAEMTQKARRLRFCFGLVVQGALMIDRKDHKSFCRIVARSQGLICSFGT
ncbi:MAG: hypothetical protein CM15mP83_8700 [Flavobacteriaceae bacterium]|nr:MAG: hypothetical protein CM15mP83_8700 [Flavobacteriaceae bacterium]